MEIVAGDGAVMTSKPQYIEGKIVGVTGRVVLGDGTQGYTTDSVRYTIAAMMTGGVVTFAGQVPQVRLWGGSMLVSAEALVGCAVPGSITGGEVRWHFYEPPSIGGCSTGGGATPTGDIPPRVREPLPEIFSPVTSGGGGGQTTDSPGVES